MLKAHGIQELVDVRTIPKSRYNPQYADVALTKSLAKAGVGYRHLASLGGLRKARADSPNMGWRNASFRGYADYMGTPEFAAGLEELTVIAAKVPTAIMCAEAVPWRCHRSLIADALTKRHWAVYNIMSATNAPKHKVTPFARVRRGVLVYPPPAD